MSPNPRRAPSRPAGFTLVEIMIGLLIGVIGIVVIMQTFAVSEGYKRTATSGTDAQVNGGIALYLLQRDLRNAGYGITPLVMAGCTSVVVWNSASGTSTAVRWVPVDVNPAGIPAGDPNTDVILVAHGTSDSFVTGVAANQVANSTDQFDITVNRDGFRNGDLVVGVQPGGGAGGSTSCVLNELTAVPSANGSCSAPLPPGSSYLLHGTSVYKNNSAACANTTPTHNAAGGIVDPGGVPVPRLNQANGAQLFDMGGAPEVKIYAIRNGNLTMCNAVTADCTNVANYDVVVNDIVSMHAIFGGDYVGSPPAGSTALGDGVVDQWSRNPLAAANDVLRTLAVAIEITARSNLREKPSPGSTTCDTTPDPTRPDRAQTTDWYQPFAALAVGSLAGAQIDVSHGGAVTDFNCYRYKLFQTVVPLRNLVWRP